MSHQLTRIVITGSPEPWRTSGFNVSDRGEVHIGSTTFELVDTSESSGIVGAVIDAPEELTLDLPSVDGLPLRTVPAPPAAAPATAAHPNGVVALDHLVAMTPDLDRTSEALATAGLELRRRRDAERDGHEMHQLFYWLGDVILEVVADPRMADDAPSVFWGLALTVDDLDATASMLGPLIGTPRTAVQKGRHIASLKRDAGLSVPIAFMTLHVAHS